MSSISLSLLLLLSVASAVYCTPLPTITQQEQDRAVDFLKKFYNMNKETGPTVGGRLTPLTRKLREMQRFLGLKITGNLDADTLAMMKKPRCGVPDNNVAKYTIYGNDRKWQKNALTYRIENYTPDMTKAEVDDSIEKALGVWAKVTPLRFTRLHSGTADIMISFGSGYHGDRDSFDGPGGTLAHASSPSPDSGVFTHFDEDEYFTYRSYGTVLFLIAAHEFGHNLGLDHSLDEDALMFAEYTYRNPNTFVLPQDDVNSIQSLYGANPDKEPNPGPGPLPPITCDSSLVLDAVSTLRGKKLFFKDRSFEVVVVLRSFEVVVVLRSFEVVEVLRSFEVVVVLRSFEVVENYLTSFFHMKEEPGPVALTQKLSEMQRFYGLHITGTLDKDTVALMKKSRCGVPDEISRYKTFGKRNRWYKKSLTYR
uniref:Peptidase metallopeptidase domain-containing protein n=1 Tax=Knipowitschia caucasica TaxID=637954 RepID=A0AAV2JBD6_KNICA